MVESIPASGHQCHQQSRGYEERSGILAQATGEFTKKELNGDSTFRWTKAAADKIDSIVNYVDDGNDGDGD